MIKKYMTQLYKEIMWYKKLLETEKLKYYGDRITPGNATNYTVLLKDGSYFYINIGTNRIPDIKKKDIAFIHKHIWDTSFEYAWQFHYTLDSDRGYYRYPKEDRYGESDYIICKEKKYKTDNYKNIDTGEWD